MKLADGLTATVKRGPESWAFIYTTLGFALAIESAVVAMIEPLRFPWNVVVYVVVAILTFRLFIASGWFQNKLIGWKTRYEERGR